MSCCPQASHRFSQGLVFCSVCNREVGNREQKHESIDRNVFATKVRQRARGASRMRSVDWLRKDVYIPSCDGIQEELW